MASIVAVTVLDSPVSVLDCAIAVRAMNTRTKAAMIVPIIRLMSPPRCPRKALAMLPANRHQGWLYVWNGRDDRGTAGRVRTAVCARVLAADRVPNSPTGEGPNSLRISRCLATSHDSALR